MAKRLHPAAYRSPSPRPAAAPPKNRMSPLPRVGPPAPPVGGGGPMKARPGRPLYRAPLRPSGPASIRPRNLLGDGTGKDPNHVNPVPFKNPAILANRAPYEPAQQSIRGDAPARWQELLNALLGGGAPQ